MICVPFARVPIPRHHHGCVAASGGVWHGWSTDFLARFDDVSAELRSLKQPALVSVRGCEPYERTYTYQLSGLPRALAGFAIDIALGLLSQPSDSRMQLFAQMFADSLTSRDLHRLFALMRAGIAALHGDGRAALQPPVPRQLRDAGFPVHADLFLTNRVWLVFDDVLRDRSGRSLFLARADLTSAMRETSALPSSVRQRIEKLLNGQIAHDAFDEFFDLLHSEKHAWQAPLAAAMRRATWSIRFRRGEGYLIDDRRWLHGRTAAHGGVRSGRFRRLVFG